MNAKSAQAVIRTLAQGSKVKWSWHALSEVGVEPFSVEQVETALGEAEVIEYYGLSRRYLPDCLALAYVAPSRPIHCVIGLNESQDYILIVTVYQPKETEWQDDWRTRK